VAILLSSSDRPRRVQLRCPNTDPNADTDPNVDTDPTPGLPTPTPAPHPPRSLPVRPRAVTWRGDRIRMTVNTYRLPERGRTELLRNSGRRHQAHGRHG
jgi:hypothetical protein